MSRPDGGPAFPALDYVIPHDLEERHVHKLGETRGMTLRDYFAAKVLASLVGKINDLSAGIEERAAVTAFRYADAMLAERAK